MGYDPAGDRHAMIQYAHTAAFRRADPERFRSAVAVWALASVGLALFPSRELDRRLSFESAAGGEQTADSARPYVRRPEVAACSGHKLVS